MAHWTPSGVLSSPLSHMEGFRHWVDPDQDSGSLGGGLTPWKQKQALSIKEIRRALYGSVLLGQR